MVTQRQVNQNGTALFFYFARIDEPDFPSRLLYVDLQQVKTAQSVDCP